MKTIDYDADYFLNNTTIVSKLVLTLPDTRLDGMAR